MIVANKGLETAELTIPPGPTALHVHPSKGCGVNYFQPKTPERTHLLICGVQLGRLLGQKIFPTAGGIQTSNLSISSPSNALTTRQAAIPPDPPSCEQYTAASQQHPPPPPYSCTYATPLRSIIYGNTTDRSRSGGLYHIMWG